MGCFLGCFGFTKKQKRIKPCNKFQVHQKYVQLDSDKANAEDSANYEPRDKQPKESPNLKVRKKVSFNLNVKAYERIQEEVSEEEEKTQWEYKEQETAKATMSTYPSSYRYYNCNDEEDEIRLEESDDLDEEEEDYGFSDDDDSYDGGDETENNKKLNKDDESIDVVVGTDYRNSVLLPVENLTQWKAVKAKGAKQVNHQKENIIKQEFSMNKPVNDCAEPKKKPQGHELSVDSSLSNWLVSARAKDHQLAVLTEANTI